MVIMLRFFCMQCVCKCLTDRLNRDAVRGTTNFLGSQETRWRYSPSPGTAIEQQYLAILHLKRKTFCTTLPDPKLTRCSINWTCRQLASQSINDPKSGYRQIGKTGSSTLNGKAFCLRALSLSLTLIIFPCQINYNFSARNLSLSFFDYFTYLWPFI